MQTSDASVKWTRFRRRLATLALLAWVGLQAAHAQNPRPFDMAEAARRKAEAVRARDATLAREQAARVQAGATQTQDAAGAMHAASNAGQQQPQLPAPTPYDNALGRKQAEDARIKARVDIGPVIAPFVAIALWFYVRWARKALNRAKVGRMVESEAMKQALGRQVAPGRSSYAPQISLFYLLL